MPPSGGRLGRAAGVGLEPGHGQGGQVGGDVLAEGGQTGQQPHHLAKHGLAQDQTDVLPYIYNRLNEKIRKVSYPAVQCYDRSNLNRLRFMRPAPAAKIFLHKFKEKLQF